MQLIKYLFLLGFFYISSLHAQQGIVFTDGSAIKDYGTKTFTETVSVNENFNRLLIHVDIQHSWVNDLEMTITNPAGDKRTVFSRLGDDSCFGCDGSDIELIFSDDAVLTYEVLNQSCDTLPAYLGNAQAMSGLDDLLNEDPNGEWTVELIDYWPYETGHINMIWMELTNYAAPDCTAFLNLEHQAKDIAVNTMIEWIPAPLATGYLLFLASAEGTVLLDYVDVGNVLSYQLPKLECGTEYDIKLTPYNVYGAAVCFEQTFETEFVTAETLQYIELCKGDTLQLGASGGTFYQWSPEAVFDNAQIQNPLFFGDKNMTISLIVSNENGCEDEVFVDVVVNEIELTIDSVNHVRLNSPGYIEISLEGNPADYLFNWTGPNGYYSGEEDIDSLEIGCYTLTVRHIPTACRLDTVICVDDLTRIPTHMLTGFLSIYPNPVQDELSVELAKFFNEALYLECVYLDGRSELIGIIEKGKAGKTLNVDKLNAGFYYLKLSLKKSGISYFIPFVKLK